MESRCLLCVDCLNDEWRGVLNVVALTVRIGVVQVITLKESEIGLGLGLGFQAAKVPTFRSSAVQCNFLASCTDQRNQAEYNLQHRQV